MAAAAAAEEEEEEETHCEELELEVEASAEEGNVQLDIPFVMDHKSLVLLLKVNQLQSRSIFPTQHGTIQRSNQGRLVHEMQPL
ncbi:hypothetical protein EGR_06997 [Echinococcus granulosus]|uniref:Uncharacterized protein n=1 Tax=Echinococcus granulosus TaxID=6210 RepID=W6UJ32_ECHGR|nr:hypothetical protein EGR_06997 [Echinococcus granulosus]EUB58167.1 hypothetical protein EGR_06997 [Echinococcus granulosus]